MGFYPDCHMLLTLNTAENGAHSCNTTPAGQEQADDLAARILDAARKHERTAGILGRIAGAGQLTEQQVIDVYLQIVTGRAGFVTVILQTNHYKPVHDAYAHPAQIFKLTSGGGKPGVQIDNADVFCTCKRCDYVSHIQVPPNSIAAANNAPQVTYSGKPPVRSLADELKDYFFVKHVAWPKL